jgi:hypothetical protein
MQVNSQWTFGADDGRLHSCRFEAGTILSVQDTSFARLVAVADKKLIRKFIGVVISLIKAGAVHALCPGSAKLKLGSKADPLRESLTGGLYSVAA